MLRDISIRYDAIEDRLLVRLGMRATCGDVDHWLHLTRRVCSRLRADLQAMVDLSASAPARLDPAAKATVSAAHHRAMAQQVPARVEVAPGPPMAVTPALVMAVECGRRRGDGYWILKFNLKDRAALTLVLAGPTLHAFVDALSHRVQGAGWALPHMAAERAASVAQPQPISPLH